MQVKRATWNSKRLPSCCQPCVYAGICGATRRYLCHVESRKAPTGEEKARSSKKYTLAAVMSCWRGCGSSGETVCCGAARQGAEAAVWDLHLAEAAAVFFFCPEWNLSDGAALCRFATESHIYTLKLCNKPCLPREIAYVTFRELSKAKFFGGRQLFKHVKYRLGNKMAFILSFHRLMTLIQIDWRDIVIISWLLQSLFRRKTFF